MTIPVSDDPRGAVLFGDHSYRADLYQ